MRQNKVNLIGSFYVKSQPTTLPSNTTFCWALQRQTDRRIFEPARTHHLGLKVQNSENSVFTLFTLGRLSWRQYIITRWSVSVVIVFPFLGAGFANIPLTLFTSCEAQTRYSKTLKYSQQYTFETIYQVPR